MVYSLSHAWNAKGHQLIAEIAYAYLTPYAKQLVILYGEDSDSARVTLSKASCYLDELRAQHIHDWDAIHYIDIPIVQGKVDKPSRATKNALTALIQADSILSSKQATLLEKKMQFKILVHVLGDIHQPLHTATWVDESFPMGDLGGNLLKLPPNRIGRNLHSYWDNGAGFLMAHHKKYAIYHKSNQLKAQWQSCSDALQKNKFQDWIEESFNLAQTQAYRLSGTKITSSYQHRAQACVRRQLFYAGCRLANYLNHLAAQSHI